jgi:hypothetical protein
MIPSQISFNTLPVNATYASETTVDTQKFSDILYSAGCSLKDLAYLSRCLASIHPTIAKNIYETENLSDQKLLHIDCRSTNEIKINQEIQSICYNEKYIGFVFKSESIMNQYILNVYNLNGKKVLDKTMDFQYSDLQMKDNLLIFNNTQQMYIISVDGILKYNGTIQEGIQKVIPGKLENRYLIITNQEAEEIKLK